MNGTKHLRVSARKDPTGRWGATRTDQKEVGSLRRVTVMWVGVSGKPLTAPLASETATGKVVDTIEQMLSGLRFHRTNLVKHAPLDDDGRLRYPTREEMVEGADSLLLDLERVRPRVVVTLGAAVSRVVVENIAKAGRFAGLSSSFSYFPCRSESLFVLPVHHPSFVLIYRRKKLQDYIQSICRWIGEIVAGAQLIGAKRVKAIGVNYT